MTYTANGKLKSMKDGEDNLTTYEYDDFDRLLNVKYPVQIKGANASSSSDFESLTYDAASNVLSRRLRDGSLISYAYDNLNRVKLKDLPAGELDVSYTYDNFNRLLSANQTGHSLTYTYDAFSRNLSQTSPLGTTSATYDEAGNRTSLTYPGSGLTINYDYLLNGQVSKIRENNATTGVGVLATFAYDDLGNRKQISFGNGAAAVYSVDALSRLKSLTQNLTGTTNDFTADQIEYNAASQVIGLSRPNDVYSWTDGVDVNRGYTSNGLNQYTMSGPITPTYDSTGNLTSAGPDTYTYTSENLLKAVTGSATATIGYDPASRLYEVASATTTRFAYDGDDIIAEYNGSNALQRRYVFGPGEDEPLVQYEGSGLTDRRFLHADEHGSIVAITDGSGNLISANRYDEYGIPASTNVGRFQYTGQVWLAELGLSYFKARFYSPTLGRFLQPDPIGVRGGINLYAYVENDPINFRDPTGLEGEGSGADIIVTGSRWEQGSFGSGDPTTSYTAPFIWANLWEPPAPDISERQRPVDEIVVTGLRSRKLGKYKLRFNGALEQSFFHYPDGRIVEQKLRKVSEKVCGDRVTEEYAPVSEPEPGFDAVIHTHQDRRPSEPLDPFPGTRDGIVPRRHNVPNYGISSVGAWVVLPGAELSVELLDGQWGAGFDPKEYTNAINRGGGDAAKGRGDVCR